MKATKQVLSVTAKKSFNTKQFIPHKMHLDRNTKPSSAFHFPRLSHLFLSSLQPLPFVRISLSPLLTPPHFTACLPLRCLIHACTAHQATNMLFCTPTTVTKGSVARVP